MASLLITFALLSSSLAFAQELEYKEEKGKSLVIQSEAYGGIIATLSGKSAQVIYDAIKKEARIGWEIDESRIGWVKEREGLRCIKSTSPKLADRYTCAIDLPHSTLNP